MMLLRLGRRHTSWEETEVTTICETEFSRRDGNGLDLQPSAYEISDDLSTIVRTQAEHSAGSNMHPPRQGGCHLDLEGCATGIHKTKAKNDYFSMARDAHREVIFASGTELRTFVRNLVADIHVRKRRVTGAEIKSYVQDRLAAQDPEWVEFCDKHPLGNRWRGLLRSTGT